MENNLIPIDLPEQSKKQVMAYVEGIKKQNIAVLGDGEVFVRRSEDGMIKAVTGAMQLKEELGQIAVIKGKVMVTADGYYDQNKIASCSTITPDFLTLPNGNKVPNPYPIIDEKSGSISKVWVKKMVLGRTPIGNWSVTSCTLLYDINMYFLQDCYKKILKNKEAGKVLMKAMVKEDELPLFLPIQGDIGIVINTNCKDILDAIETLIQKKLFAERLAQTVCERVCMKKHAAFTSKVEVSGKDNNKVGKAKVVGWVNDITKEQLLDIAKKLERGEPIEIDGEKVIVNDEIMPEVPEEDLKAGEYEDDYITDDEPDTAEDTPDNDESELSELRYSIASSIAIIGQAKYDELLKPFNKPLEKLNKSQLETFRKVINAAIDKEALL
jgi:hypothetical protein